MTNAGKHKLFLEKLAQGQERLHLFVASMLPFSPDDVDDAVQDANLAMLRAWDKWDSSRPFRPWMLCIACNTVVDRLRKKSSGKLVFDGEMAQTAAGLLLAEDAPDGGMLERLAICRRKLPGKYAQMVKLRYAKKLSSQEIARRLAIAPGSVNGIFAHIRRKLRECVLRLCELPEGEIAAQKADDFDETFAECFDCADDVPAEKRERLIVLAQSSPERWLEQMQTHLALQMLHEKESSLRAIRFRRFSRVAALAVFGAGVVFAALRSPVKQTQEKKMKASTVPILATAVFASVHSSVSSETLKWPQANTAVSATAQSSIKAQSLAGNLDTTGASKAPSASGSVDTFRKAKASSREGNLNTTTFKGTVILLQGN